MYRHTLWCARLWLRAFAVGGIALALASCSKEAKTARALKSADGYFANGRFDEAKIEYANVLRLDPANAKAIRSLGTLWMEQGSPMRALPYLLRSYKDAPKDIEVRVRLATAFVGLGARSDAAKTAAGILQDDPANETAVVALADCARSPAEVQQVSELIEKFPAKDTASYQLAIGSIQLKRGEIDKGESSIREAVRLNPDDPLPHLSLANLARSRRQLDVAAKEYQVAASLAKQRSIVRISHVEFLMQTGRIQEAEEALKPVLAATPGYLPAQRLGVQVAFASGKKEVGEKLIQEALRRDPENLETVILRTQIWAAQGEGKKGSELLERAIKRFPSYSPLRFELARCENASGNPDRAIQILDELVGSDPENAEAVLVLNELRLQQGDVKTAISALEGFCRTHQDIVPARLLLARNYRIDGRHSDAIAIYRELAEKGKAGSGVHFLLGITQREIGDLAAAEKSFNEALAANPNAFEAFAQLVELDLLRKDYAKASGRIAEESRTRSPTAEVMLLQAKVDAAQERWSEAEETLKRACDLNPSLFGVYELLVQIYLTTGRLKDAGVQAEALCARNPNDVKALTTAAVIRGQLGKKDEAIAGYERLLAKKSDSVVALNNLACLYAEQAGQLDKAFDLARRARDLQPSSAAVADTFGWVQYKRKEYNQALVLLLESSGQLSSHAEALYHLAMVYYAMGQTKKAADTLSKAAALPQDFPGKAEIPEKLSLLAPAGNYSIEKLIEMSKSRKDDLYVWLRLGQKLRDDGRSGEAVAAFQAGLAVNQKASQFLVELASLNAGPLKKPDIAAEHLRKAQSVGIGDAEYLLAAGKVALNLRDWSSAYRLLQGALEASTEQVGISLELVTAAFALGKEEEARSLANRVLNSGAPGERLIAKRSLELIQLASGAAVEQGDRVIADALAQNPDNPIAVMAAASSCLKRGDRTGAISQYNRMLKLTPDFPPALKGLATLYVDDPAKRAEAEALASRALRSLPDDASLLLTLAQTSFYRKDYAHARSLIEDSGRKAPLSSRAQYFLGVCNWELKDPRGAAENLRKAMAGDLPDLLRAEAQRILKLCEEASS